VHAAVPRQEARDARVDVLVRGRQVARDRVDVVLRDREEPAGEGVLVEVPPDRHDALVLLRVDHAVQLVDHGEEPAVAGRRVVALARHDADPHDPGTAAELDGRQVAGEVDHDAAARAAGHAEDHDDDRRRLGGVDALREGLELLGHLAVLVVLGAVDRLGDGAREVPAGGRNLRVGGQPRLVVRVPVVPRVLHLQELAVAPQVAEERVAGRGLHRDGADVGAVGGQARGGLAHGLDVLVADVDGERAEAGPGILEEPLRPVAQELGDDLGAGLPEPDDVQGERPFVLVGAMDALVPDGLNAGEVPVRPVRVVVTVVVVVVVVVVVAVLGSHADLLARGRRRGATDAPAGGMHPLRPPHRSDGRRVSAGCRGADKRTGAARTTGSG
jgi:hypothetical protein